MDSPLLASLNNSGHCAPLDRDDQETHCWVITLDGRISQLLGGVEIGHYLVAGTVGVALVLGSSPSASADDIDKHFIGEVSFFLRGKYLDPATITAIITVALKVCAMSDAGFSNTAMEFITSNWTRQEAVGFWGGTRAYCPSSPGRVASSSCRMGSPHQLSQEDATSGSLEPGGPGTPGPSSRGTREFGSFSSASVATVSRTCLITT